MMNNMMRTPIIDGVALNKPGGNRMSYSPDEIKALGVRFPKLQIVNGLLDSDFGPS